MRLIDADALRKEIHMSYSDDLGICEVIDNQPTAFNVDAVVKQIHKAKLGGRIDAGIIAKELIRKGGVNERD